MASSISTAFILLFYPNDLAESDAPSVRIIAGLHPALDALALDFESISAQSSMAVGDAIRRGGVENSTPGARFLLVLPTVHSNCE
ncbi:hypothetical protein AEM42_10215 [Betaproteobacteria bacterium UKL13-2]|nr:hypothetical protein AEM42_10215 [Betaproteobacteria bacterium UKL13-2]HCG52513.1 hypothetical protein [Betaproteobacteria bacterium]